MGWLDGLRGKKVGLDTAPIIYFIEEHPLYLPVVRPFFEMLDKGEFAGVTSTITLLEVLVHPFRQGDEAMVNRYKEVLLGARNLDVLATLDDIAEEAARLRATYNLRTPDAIQMATALYAGASFFLTNDLRLPFLPELEILVLDRLLACT